MGEENHSPLGPPPPPPVPLEQRSSLLWQIAFFLFAISAALSWDTYIPVAHFYADFPVELLAFGGLLMPFFSRQRPWFLIGYLVCVMISAVLAGTFPSGIRYVTIALYSTFGALYLLHKNNYRISPLLVAMNVAAIVFMIQTFRNTGEVFYDDMGWHSKFHGYPFTGSRLSMGMFLSLVITGNAIFFSTSRGVLVKALYLTGLAASVIAMALTIPRSSMFATTLGLCLVLFFGGSKRALPVLFLFAIAIATAIIVYAKDPTVAEALRHRMQAGGFESGSFRSRLISWQAYLTAIGHEPLGIGFERSQFEFWAGKYSSLRTVVAGAHNEFLKILVEVGWVPFAIWVGYLVKAARRGWTTHFVTPEYKQFRLVALVWGVLLFVQFLTDNEMQMNEVAVFFWTTVAMLFAMPMARMHESVGLRSAMGGLRRWRPFPGPRPPGGPHARNMPPRHTGMMPPNPGTP